MANDPGTWNGLPDAESASAELWSGLLGRLEAAVGTLHDAPNDLIALAEEGRDRPEAIVAGEALQRALEDLRATWLLLKAGYMAAAAATIADLWEHAMLATCVVRDEPFAQTFMKPEPVERPEPGELAERAVQLVAEPGADAERTMLEFSVGYEWLRQVKHRGYERVTGGVEDDAAGLRVTARPVGNQFDPDDVRMMLAVAFIALRRALGQLALTLSVDMESGAGQELAARIEGAWKVVQETR